MIRANLSLENKQILLRPLVEQDFSLLLKLTQDKSLWEYFTHDLSTLEGIKSWASPALKRDRHQLVLVDKTSGKVMGSSGFGNYSEPDQRLEIGWTWIGKDFQGTGVNSQMKFLMFEYAFEELGMERVELKTDVLNQAARKALLKLGLVEEGILRSHTLLCTGRRRDTIYYSLLKNEWPTFRKSFEKRNRKGQ
ncbi:MAG: GNAT family N-acetyltransferase [Algoriphagus sp.]|uniref:GNAT family N-acetyltransferase n=1 Tax=Algoriphagus sp. TaxID=1872435 RepID=UPI0017AD89BD|nr:GNAT family protein [Algoriphagus sp.]NVJ85313.1 GNAT family N-acetyltransferase [Algoriphagus sp.]